jgi:hypothetical protein
MVDADRKSRYRYRAVACYETAATRPPEEMRPLLRLGDTYAALAADRSRTLPQVFVSLRNFDHTLCPGCGQAMQPGYSFRRTKWLPAAQVFWCRSCQETLFWRGVVPSHRPKDRPISSGGRFTRYIAAAFRRAGDGFAPGPVVECPDAELAVQRAQLMVREPEIAGAVAFSRAENADTGDYEPAIILATFGDIPANFDID